MHVLRQEEFEVKRVLALLLALAAVGCASSGHTTNAAATQTPASIQHTYSWTFQTMDNPAGTANVLTGVDQWSKIVGYYETAGPSGLILSASGVSTIPPYKHQYIGGYPGASMSFYTDAWAYFIAGYYLLPNGPVAFYRMDPLVASHYPTLQTYNTYGTPGTAFLSVGHQLCPTSYGSKSCPGQNLKYNDPQFVGYQTTVNGQEAIQVDGVTKQLTTFAVPGAVQSVATGINDRLWACGYFINASGVTEGWYTKNSKFWTFQYPGAVATYFLGLNWQEDIVGYFIDAAGATHGFMLVRPAEGPVWEQVDYPNENTTKVYSVNQHHLIVGSYLDSNSVSHGFLGTPVTPSPSPSPMPTVAPTQTPTVAPTSTPTVAPTATPT